MPACGAEANGWWAVGHSAWRRRVGTREETDGEGWATALSCEMLRRCSHFQNMAAHMSAHRHRGIFPEYAVLLDQSLYAAHRNARRAVNEMRGLQPHGTGADQAGLLRIADAASQRTLDRPRRAEDLGRSRHCITPSDRRTVRAHACGFAQRFEVPTFECGRFSIRFEQRNLQQPRPFRRA